MNQFTTNTYEVTRRDILKNMRNIGIGFAGAGVVGLPSYALSNASDISDSGIHRLIIDPGVQDIFRYAQSEELASSVSLYFHNEYSHEYISRFASRLEKALFKDKHSMSLCTDIFCRLCAYEKDGGAVFVGEGGIIPLINEVKNYIPEELDMGLFTMCDVPYLNAYRKVKGYIARVESGKGMDAQEKRIFLGYLRMIGTYNSMMYSDAAEKYMKRDYVRKTPIGSLLIANKWVPVMREV